MQRGTALAGGWALGAPAPGLGFNASRKGLSLANGGTVSPCQPLLPSTACSAFKAKAAKLLTHGLARPWAGNGTEPPVIAAAPRGTCTLCPVSWKSRGVQRCGYTKQATGGPCSILEEKTPSWPRETGGSPAAERLAAVTASPQALLSLLPSSSTDSPSGLMVAWCLKAHEEMF